MCTHLIVAMRDGYARRYVTRRSLLNTDRLLAGISSARVVGAPGYGMCIAVDDQDVEKLTKRLTRFFVIEEVRTVPVAVVSNIA